MRIEQFLAAAEAVCDAAASVRRYGCDTLSEVEKTHLLAAADLIHAAVLGPIEVPDTFPEEWND